MSGKKRLREDEQSKEEDGNRPDASENGQRISAKSSRSSSYESDDTRPCWKIQQTTRWLSFSFYLIEQLCQIMCSPVNLIWIKESYWDMKISQHVRYQACTMRWSDYAIMSYMKCSPEAKSRSQVVVLAHLHLVTKKHLSQSNPSFFLGRLHSVRLSEVLSPSSSETLAETDCF